MDTTYRWDWTGQSLAGVSKCTFSFAKIGVQPPIAWSTSRNHNAWSTTAQASSSAEAGYVHIELNARYCWGSDLIAGRAMENWHALIKGDAVDTVPEGNCSV